MIDMTSHTNFDEKKLKQTVAEANKKAMHKSAAFIMRMARQRIRLRKYRMASRPGQSPFKHRAGSNSFSHSIRFGVDAAGTTAVIGPRREMEKPENASGPVPHTLEFGGTTRPDRNVMWFQTKNAPVGATSVGEVANWFASRGRAPLFMATTPSELRRRAKWNMPDDKIRVKKAIDPRRRRDGRYRLIYYYYAKISSSKQAMKAAKQVVKYFGYPTVAASHIAARPYMGPTLAENQEKISAFWRNLT